MEIKKKGTFDIQSSLLANLSEFNEQIKLVLFLLLCVYLVARGVGVSIASYGGIKLAIQNNV